MQRLASAASESSAADTNASPLAGVLLAALLGLLLIEPLLAWKPHVGLWALLVAPVLGLLVHGGHWLLGLFLLVMALAALAQRRWAHR